MQVDPIITELEARVLSQTALMGTGPDVESSVTLLLELLRPALRQAAMSLAEQAADEVRAQLADHTVDVTVVGGDPVLRLHENRPAGRTTLEEELDARITLRLPPSLKNAIESYAGDTGESVNSWVVKALEGKAGRRSRGGRVDTTFEI